MPTDCCGPDRYYICKDCMKEHFPEMHFSPMCDNDVGRKCCHWCGDNTPSRFDAIHCH